MITIFIFILKQQRKLLPIKGGPTVKKKVPGLFSGRGLNAEVAKQLKPKLINVYTREEYSSGPVYTTPLYIIDLKLSGRIFQTLT